MPDASTFAGRLHQYRLAAGLTQEALAERAGLSVAAVAALERGRRAKPRLATIALLADALALERAERSALQAAVELSPRAISAPLPAPGTALIGRDGDLAAVAGLLVRHPGHDAARLVTLTGPGGVGKTRLAQAVVAALQDSFPDGAAFADLSALRDPNLVAATLAVRLGIWERAGPPPALRLAEGLRAKAQLLVIDNFEQVAAAAPLLADLLRACPALTLLVTSRTALRLRGERPYAVGPLALPAAEATSSEALVAAPATRLFLARAMAVLPGWEPSTADAAAIVRLCRRLDGLPLAIELAAAQLERMSTPELATRLEHGLPLAAPDPPTRPARQRTLQATIAWSYGLLDEAEQRAFRRLAVFVGGWSTPAGEAVTGAGLDELEGLVESSLIRRETANGDGRLRLLETVRAFAWEQLVAAGEDDATQQAHARYYLAVAVEAAPALLGAASAAWLDRLDMEQGNLRAALDWAVRRDRALGYELVTALGHYWRTRAQPAEGRRWLGKLLADAADVPAAGLAPALLLAANLAVAERDFPDAATLFVRLARIEEAMDAATKAWVRFGRTALALAECRVPSAALVAAEEEFRRLGDQRGVALALAASGDLAALDGDVAAARRRYAESLACCQVIGDLWDATGTLARFAGFLRDHGRPDLARERWAACLEQRRQLGDRGGLLQALVNLANVERILGDYPAAAQHLEEASALAEDGGGPRRRAEVDLVRGHLAAAQADGAGAREAYERCLTFYRRLGDFPWMAVVLGDLGNLARQEGDYERACTVWLEALRISPSGLGGGAFAWKIGNAAAALLRRGDAARGVRLLAAVAAGYPPYREYVDPDEVAAWDAALAAARVTLGEAAYMAAWAGGSTLPVAAAVTETLAALLRS